MGAFSAGAYWLLNRPSATPQSDGLGFDLGIEFDLGLDMTLSDLARANEVDINNANLRAFLRMIRHAEGTLSAGNDGYGMMFGGLITRDLSDHPRQVHCHLLGGREICSSAAGAYQFLQRTWDWIAHDLPDFSPQSQDLAAGRLIRYRGALQDVYHGRFNQAVEKVKKEWASMPDAGYGQPEKSLAELQRVYTNGGGSIA